MGGVDLANMLISIYQIPIKTHRWYIKVFWHLIDIAKVNGWIIYRKYCEQNRVPVKPRMTLIKFFTDIARGLMHAKQPDPKIPHGRPL